jgi:hypothetical protein
MKKVLGLLALATLALTTLSVTVSAKDKSWTGWISDSGCGTKGASADHAACAAKCVKEKGASWVFVNGKDNKVIPIHNQDAVNADNDLGHQVKVTGDMMPDGSLHVTSVMAAGGNMAKPSM